jgi:hypothetical protein
MSTTIEFENERVKVLRVKHGPRERHPQTSRKDRLVIYLTDGHVRRAESGQREELRRKAGEVVWRGRSEHQIENLKDAHQEVIVVEFKN